MGLSRRQFTREFKIGAPVWCIEEAKVTMFEALPPARSAKIWVETV
jgi:hypothetical protein